jgi:hypothetical protein
VELSDELFYVPAIESKYGRDLRFAGRADCDIVNSMAIKFRSFGPHRHAKLGLAKNG